MQQAFYQRLAQYPFPDVRLASKNALLWQEYLEALTPVDRFFTDYVHGDSGDWRVGRTACLRDTPYGGELKNLGVRMSWKKPTSRYNKETDTLTITPPSGEPLLLTGFDQYVHPVTPRRFNI